MFWLSSYIQDCLRKFSWILDRSCHIAAVKPLLSAFFPLKPYFRLFIFLYLIDVAASSWRTLHSYILNSEKISSATRRAVKCEHRETSSHWSYFPLRLYFLLVFVFVRGQHCFAMTLSTYFYIITTSSRQQCTFLFNHRACLPERRSHQHRLFQVKMLYVGNTYQKLNAKILRNWS